MRVRAVFAKFIELNLQSCVIMCGCITCKSSIPSLLFYLYFVGHYESRKIIPGKFIYLTATGKWKCVRTIFSGEK
jgi:hypothetical protein